MGPMVIYYTVTILVEAPVIYYIEDRDDRRLDRHFDDASRALMRASRRLEELEERAQAAAERERKQRLQSVKATLKLVHAQLKAATDLALSDGGVRLDLLTRLFAVANMLTKVEKKLGPDGSLDRRSQRFFDLAEKWASGFNDEATERLTAQELTELDEYLDTEQTTSLIEFLHAALTDKCERLEQTQKRLENLQTSLTHEVGILRAAENWDATPLNRQERIMKEADLVANAKRYEKVVEQLTQLRMILVPVRRLADPSRKRNVPDQKVEKLLQRKLCGDEIRPDEIKYLETYAATYYGDTVLFTESDERVE